MTHFFRRTTFSICLLCLGFGLTSHAQIVLGSITGTVKDTTGGTVGDATVKIHNVGTNLEITTKTQSNGSFVVNNLPIGAYEVTFSKAGFDTERNTQVIVQGDRTSTVDASLKVGAVSTNLRSSDSILAERCRWARGSCFEDEIEGEKWVEASRKRRRKLFSMVDEVFARAAKRRGVSASRRKQGSTTW